MSNTASSADPLPPRIALTVGEPAGIGPDLLVEIAVRGTDAALVAFTDPDLIAARARALGRALQIAVLPDARQAVRGPPGLLQVVPVPLSAAAVPGNPDPANAGAVLDAVRAAVRACSAGTVNALVTGPIGKSVINDAGIPFSGLTEFLGDLCGAFPVMMLMNEALRVVLVTTHLPLAGVSAALTAERLERTLLITDADLRNRFGIETPKLLVCGLNPHAGEAGHLGREEITVIAPVLAALRARGLDLRGPVAADTAFTPAALIGIDAVVTMYHDQGLPVLKAQGFGSIVNVTLGLPIIRTAVDHGTALDLAGSGRARPDSLLAAIASAAQLSTRQEAVHQQAHEDHERMSG
jgi:4-hydroxythreonine-4-phosphate dehydrogenase